MDTRPLPWSEREVALILPHREPFLFVDRIVELAPERSIVGERTWSAHEARIATPDGMRAVPAAYLTECMAQVGAVLILGEPRNRGRYIYFLGIDRVRYRSAVRAGETLRVEARVLRLRGNMGMLSGSASVAGRPVAQGVMKFALGEGMGRAA